MHFSFGHWVLALLISSFLIVAGLFVFVHQPSQPPLLPANEVVMTLRSPDLLFPPPPPPPSAIKPPMSPPPASVPPAVPVTEVPNIPLSNGTPANIEPIAPVPSVKKPLPQPELKLKPDQKPKPKPKPKPEPKPEPKPKPESIPPSPVTHPSAPRAPALTSRVTAAIGMPVRPPVSLSAKDRDAYRAILFDHLAAAKRYPKRAQRRRIQGEVTVSFVLNKLGKVLKKQIEKSSGADILDRAALSMIDRASPLPVPPPGYGDEPHRFRIPVSFSLR